VRTAVYRKAVKILETYFGAEAVDESDVVPGVDATGMYTFGSSFSQPQSGFKF
jgi:hypothetical protein